MHSLWSYQFKEGDVYFNPHLNRVFSLSFSSSRHHLVSSLIIVFRDNILHIYLSKTTGISVILSPSCLCLGFAYICFSGPWTFIVQGNVYKDTYEILNKPIKISCLLKLNLSSKLLIKLLSPSWCQKTIPSPTTVILI